MSSYLNAVNVSHHNRFDLPDLEVAGKVASITGERAAPGGHPGGSSGNHPGRAGDLPNSLGALRRLGHGMDPAI